MANRLSKEKASLIASNYMTNGLRKVDALLDAGYSKTYANNVGLKLFDNDQVKQAIALIQAKNVADTAWTFKDSQDKLLHLAEQAETAKQFASSISAVVAVNRMNAWDKQTTVSEHTPDQPIGKEADVLDKLNKQYKIKLSGTG